LRAMDYIIAAIATVAVFVYLIFALLRPERF
jgi:K+-transporting ATPase KdpF subunit